MNVDTGEIRPHNELTEEEKSSGKWKPLSRAQRIARKLSKHGKYTKTGPSFLAPEERRRKRKAQRAARKRQRRAG